jgi:RND family efflux transporter MFP subunit
MTSRAKLRGTVLIVVVVCAAVIAFMRFGGRQSPAATAQKAAQSAVEVSMAKARVEGIRSFRELPATVEPTRLARLASPAEGPVSRLLVREGDLVKNGQLLAVIGRNRTTQARLSSDREELRKVQDEFGRVDRLVAKGAVPGELLDKAKADLERAKAMVEAGEESVSDHRIRAPWSGVISQVLVQEGNYVAPRAILLEVFDPASLVLRIALPESISAVVQRGADAQVRFDAFPAKEVTGTVTRVFPELDRRLRTRTAEISVEDPGVPMSPGMFARVRVAVETVREAVVVPAMAVVTTAKQEKAFYVVSEGVAKLRVGEVGIEDGNRVQVLSGLSAGEQVVVGGQQKLKDGTRVQVKADAVKAQAPQGGALPAGQALKVDRP